MKTNTKRDELVIDEELDFSEVEVEEELDDIRSKKKSSIVKKIVIFIVSLLVLSMLLCGLYVLLEKYTESLIKVGIERGIENYGYNEEPLYIGKYLALTKEGDELIIRPKDKKFTIGFDQWINKYYTITNEDKLEITNGSLQEYGFEVYFIDDNKEIEGFEGWLHCEVYRGVIVIHDAQGGADEEQLTKMATSFITHIEPQLNKDNKEE